MIGLQFSADEVTGIIKTMGDTAAGVGMDKMPIFIKTIGEMKSLKRVEWEALKRIALTGAPIIEDMANSYGVSAEAFKKMVAAGTVKVDDVLASMKRLTTGDGPFSGMMEKQSTSLLGLWSTIMGTLDDMIKRTGQSLLPIWKELMKTYIKWFKTAQKGIESKLVKFYKELSDAVLFSFETLKSSWSAIDTVVQLMGGWGKVIKATAFVLGGVLVAGIGMVTVALWSMVPALFSATAAGSPLLLMAIVAAAKFLLIGAAVLFLILLVQDFIVWMQGGESKFESFYESVGKGIEKIKEWATVAYDWIVEKLKMLGTLIKKWVQSMPLFKIMKFVGSAVLPKLKKSEDNINKIDGTPGPDSIRGMANTGKGESTINQNNKVDVNLNVEGLSPEASEDEIAKKTGNEIDRALREANRDSLAVAI